MSATGFYSAKHQFLREWRILWRTHGLDVFLGGVYVLLGFYAFHRVGVSQVYNVLPPFVVAGIAAGYLTYVVHAPQCRGRSVPFYQSLPRSRALAWDAQSVFILCAILWMEAAILIGTALKLGGAGMTPHYRLHPEAFAVPYLVMAAVSSYVHVRHSKTEIAVWVLGLLGALYALYTWIGIGFWEDACKENNYLPAREFSLKTQWLFALLMMAGAVLVAAHGRRHWRRRQVGEIQ